MFWGNFCQRKTISSLDAAMATKVPITEVQDGVSHHLENKTWLQLPK